MCKKLKMERILENLFFLLFDTKINSYINIKSPLLIYFMNKELSAERSIRFSYSPIVFFQIISTSHTPVSLSKLFIFGRKPSLS